MKVLVLATDYPNNDGHVTLMYIHSRNVYYQKHGIDVTVLNFSANSSYQYQNISVISLADYEAKNDKYDILICHAANLRNHYKFLKKYGALFPHFVFFFHGHEVLRIRETYSTPYSYIKKRKISDSFVQDIYDSYKLKIWRNYFPKVKEKSTLIFVSGWMKNKFKKYVGIDPDTFETYIIHNNVGEVFQSESYDSECEKKYDFITIRSNIDGSKYCIDVVNRLANENPSLSFCVVGEGDYFEHNEKAVNIEWVNRSLKHAEIPAFLNLSKCALMPTRLDAQGVMMCEMATYGIPVITSDIDICQEVSTIFENMLMINNEKTVDLNMVLDKTKGIGIVEKNKTLFSENTVGKEVSIIKELINGKQS